VIEVLWYDTESGKEIVRNWVASLDRPMQARILSRIARLEYGNFGDYKPLQEGIYELRFDFGPGYRLYYGMLGKTCVLLLGGGDKRKQSADIKRAIENFNDYKQRGEQP
jgi:putative addiction module killer protein